MKSRIPSLIFWSRVPELCVYQNVWETGFNMDLTPLWAAPVVGLGWSLRIAFPINVQVLLMLFIGQLHFETTVPGSYLSWHSLLKKKIYCTYLISHHHVKQAVERATQALVTHYFSFVHWSSWGINT